MVVCMSAVREHVRLTAESTYVCCRRKTKASMAKLWQKVYEANYHKSLDHRSFYFKQVCCPCWPCLYMSPSAAFSIELLMPCYPELPSLGRQCLTFC